jgi:hypothetical protein
MGTDCKSVGESLRRFESYSAHQDSVERKAMSVENRKRLNAAYLTLSASHALIAQR